jgi:hypothetical protein
MKLILDIARVINGCYCEKITISCRASQSGLNLINIQRQGLRLKLRKASTGMHVGLRLTATFKSYKHRLEAYFRK